MSSLTPTDRRGIASDRIKPSDHGAFIIITAGIIFGITIMALCLRLFQRWPWSKLLKTEDYALLFATVRCMTYFEAFILTCRGSWSRPATSPRMQQMCTQALKGVQSF